jgi:hypothetical protein
MALRLKPPVAIWRDIRDLTRWCTEALVDGVVSTNNIEDESITLPKLADIPTNTLLGRSTALDGPVETVSCTAAGRALLDDVDASAQRTTLGLGTAATQATGTSGATVPLLNGANVHASAKCTLFAVGSATPVGTQAANADTSGATLGQIETEVNEIKSMLRTFGLIAP